VGKRACWGFSLADRNRACERTCTSVLSSKYTLSTSTLQIHSLTLAGFLGNGGASVLFNKLASPLGGAAVLNLSNEVWCKCAMGNGCS
jgi:hypothetical protein